MEQFSITTVVVVSNDGKVEGAIHLHDILKAGIAR
jgi:high-affinity K+ transport system ATPase subunit B